VQFRCNGDAQGHNRKEFAPRIPKTLVPEGAARSKFASATAPHARRALVDEYLRAHVHGAQTQSPFCILGTHLALDGFRAHARPGLEAAIAALLHLPVGAVSLGLVYSVASTKNARSNFLVRSGRWADHRVPAARRLLEDPPSTRVCVFFAPSDATLEETAAASEDYWALAERLEEAVYAGALRAAGITHASAVPGLVEEAPMVDVALLRE
jgi:hypothetical protein